MGYTATWAGLTMAPVGALAILLSPWVGRNVGRLDPRWMASVAFVCFFGVMWMRSEFDTQTPFSTILLPTLLQGAPVALFFIPLQTVIFSGLRPDQIAAGAGLSNFVRIMSGAVGTSLMTMMWENRAALHHAQLAEQIHQGRAAADQMLAQLGAAGLDPAQFGALINRLIDQQAYTMAATDLFRLASWLFLALALLPWLTKRPRSAAAGGGGAH
jgi:DHA2 family multidrug resistance protein